jgi:hypothetical protein
LCIAKWGWRRKRATNYCKPWVVFPFLLYFFLKQEIKMLFIKDICKMKWVLIKSEPHLSVLIKNLFLKISTPFIGNGVLGFIERKVLK